MTLEPVGSVCCLPPPEYLIKSLHEMISNQLGKPGYLTWDFCTCWNVWVGHTGRCRPPRGTPTSRRAGPSSRRRRTGSAGRRRGAWRRPAPHHPRRWSPPAELQSFWASEGFNETRSDRDAIFCFSFLAGWPCESSYAEMSAEPGLSRLASPAAFFPLYMLFMKFLVFRHSSVLLSFHSLLNEENWTSM